MGASGSGKTTLLNCISTIDTVSDGHILLDGRDITTIDENDIAAFRRDYLGFVFQDFNLLDTLTLEENIALPLTISGTSPKEIDERVQRIADKLHISDILKKYPIQVSGGQKQRCAFARAVICNPKLIMADEPTGALDSNSSRILLEMMSDFKGEMGSTILMVTHDRYFLDRVANRIVEVDHGNLYNYPGSYSEFVKLKEERQNMALATQRKRKSLLRTELEWLSRGARARSTKQKAHIDRIKAMQEMKDIQEERRVTQLQRRLG